jgi:hypothetical protein
MLAFSFGVKENMFIVEKMAKLNGKRIDINP